MFTLGTSEGTQASRVKKYLDVKYMDLEYTTERDGMGFVQFEFPTLDEEEFKNLVFLLKRMDGVTLMGADSQLTETKIMKLANLLKENPNVGRSIPNPDTANYPMQDDDTTVISILQRILQDWSRKQASGFYRDEQHRGDEYYLDINELVEQWKMNTEKETKNTSLQEQKVRKLIRKTLRK